MWTWQPPAHAGLKVAFTYLFSFALTVLCLAPFTLSDAQFEQRWGLLFGAFIVLFAYRWLHLRLFAPPRQIGVGLFCAGVIVLCNLLDWQPLPAFGWDRVTTALVAGFGAGWQEELLFRGPLLAWLWLRHPKRLNAYWWASVVSALAFGALHLTNLDIQPDLTQTLLQVVYASAMGFAAAAIVFTTHNLWFTIGMHSLFDAIAAYWDPAMVSQVDLDWWSVTSLLIMIVVCLGVGIVLLRRMKKCRG